MGTVDFVEQSMAKKHIWHPVEGMFELSWLSNAWNANRLSNLLPSAELLLQHMWPHWQHLRFASATLTAGYSRLQGSTIALWWPEQFWWAAARWRWMTVSHTLVDAGPHQSQLNQAARIDSPCTDLLCAHVIPLMTYALDVWLMSTACSRTRSLTRSSRSAICTRLTFVNRDTWCICTCPPFEIQWTCCYPP